MDRADVGKLVRAPGHADGEGHGLQDLWNARQDCLSWLTSFVFGHVNIFFALNLAEFDVSSCQAFATDKALCRLGEVAICVQGNLLSRTLEIFCQVSLLVRQATDTNR